MHAVLFVKCMYVCLQGVLVDRLNVVLEVLLN